MNEAVLLACLEGVRDHDGHLYAQLGIAEGGLLWDSTDTFYAEVVFGVDRLDVPDMPEIYTYLNARARFFYFPGFLLLALRNLDSDLVYDILEDLTEPSMLHSSDRHEMWRLLLDDEALRPCILLALPALECETDPSSSSEVHAARSRERVWLAHL